jgi:hypothetical protein
VNERVPNCQLTVRSRRTRRFREKNRSLWHVELRNDEKAHEAHETEPKRSDCLPSESTRNVFLPSMRLLLLLMSPMRRDLRLPSLFVCALVPVICGLAVLKEASYLNRAFFFDAAAAVARTTTQTGTPIDAAAAYGASASSADSCHVVAASRSCPCSPRRRGGPDRDQPQR